MNGLTVIVAITAVLILFEEIVPRLRFRDWKRRQAKLLAAHKKHAAARAEGGPSAAGTPSAAGGPQEPAVVPCGLRIPAWKVRMVKKARDGDADSMAKLGNLALQHHKLVEAYYWKWRLETTKKILLMNPSLRQLRRLWRKKGCPSERQNVYEGFDETSAGLIRALLRLQCGIETETARRRIADLAEAGNEEAKWMARSYDVKDDADDEKEDGKK